MADLSKLSPGLSGVVDIVVTEDKLAPTVGSGHVHVYASPMLIAAFEGAAVAAIEHLLPEGHVSLGVHLDVAHLAPTPQGLTVTAKATLREISGRKLIFTVEAEDSIEPIGRGTHTRIIVDRARFDERHKAKSGA